jgi:glyoxylase-like metal-dependent hydrolase (beta-lactamase superfamily II)
MNANQANDLRESGDRTLELFRQQGPDVARLLEGVGPVAPDETYQGEHEIDLGGKRVLLREVPAHSHGDQIVFLPHERILFTGDLVENHFTPLFLDPTANGVAWIAVLAQLTALAPSTVIPGHGERGNVALIQEYHDYLVFVKDLVQARILEGQTIAVIERDGSPIVQERYPDWDASIWIRLAIRAFYSALTGTVLPPMF